MVKKTYSQLRNGDVFFVDEYKCTVERSRAGIIKILKCKNNILVDYVIEKENNDKTYYIAFNLINKHHTVELPYSRNSLDVLDRMIF